MTQHGSAKSAIPDGLDERVAELLEKYPTLAACNGRIAEIEKEERTLQGDIAKHGNKPSLVKAFQDELAPLQAERKEIESLIRAMQEKRTEVQKAEAEKPHQIQETAPMIRTHFADTAETLAVLAAALKSPETKGDEQDGIARAKALLATLNAGLASLETAAQKPTVESITSGIRQKKILREVLESFYGESMAPNEAEIQSDDLHKLTPSQQERALVRFFMMQESGATAEEANTRFNELSRSKEYLTLKREWNRATERSDVSQEEAMFALTMFAKALSQPTKEGRERLAKGSMSLRAWNFEISDYMTHSSGELFFRDDKYTAKKLKGPDRDPKSDLFDMRMRYKLMERMSSNTAWGRNKSTALYVYASWSLWRKTPQTDEAKDARFLRCFHIDNEGKMDTYGNTIIVGDDGELLATEKLGQSVEDVKKEAAIIMQDLLPALNVHMARSSEYQKGSFVSSLGNNFVRQNTAIGNLELKTPDASDINHIGQVAYMREQKEVQEAAYQLFGPTDNDADAPEGTPEPLIVQIKKLEEKIKEVRDSRDEASRNSPIDNVDADRPARRVMSDLTTRLAKIDEDADAKDAELQDELQEIDNKGGGFFGKKKSSRGRTRADVVSMIEANTQERAASKRNLLNSFKQQLKILFPEYEFGEDTTAKTLSEKLNARGKEKEREIGQYKEKIARYNAELRRLLEEYAALSERATKYKNKVGDRATDEVSPKRSRRLEGTIALQWTPANKLRESVGSLLDQ